MKVSIALGSSIAVLIALTGNTAQAELNPDSLQINIHPKLPGTLERDSAFRQMQPAWGDGADWSATGLRLQRQALRASVINHATSSAIARSPLPLAVATAQRTEVEPPQPPLRENVRHTLQDLLVYSSAAGMVAFLLWNRLLKREITLRQETEQRFQALANNAPGVIYQYLLRQDGTDALLYISSRCREVWGVEPEAAVEDVGRLWALVHPDDLANMRATIFRSARSLKPWNHEWRIVTQEGQPKWVEGSAVPHRQENGDVVWDGLVIDVNDRKVTENALRESESRFQKLADNIPGILYGYCLRPDETEQFTYISSGFEEVYGFPPDTALRDCNVVWRLIHPEDVERMRRSVVESYQTLQVWQAQYRVITPSGELKWLQAVARPTQQANGDVLWDGLIIDVSVRKQAELALRISESRLNTLISNLPGFVYRVANDRHYTAEFLSQGIFDITGYQPEDYFGSAAKVSLGEQLHPHDRDRVWNLVQQALKRQQPYECEYRIVTRTGEINWVWERGQGIFDDQGKLYHLEGFVSDISDRKRTQLALQESETRYRQVVEAQTDFILRSLPDTTITFANEALCRALGVTAAQIVGKRWSDLANSDDLQQVIFKQLACLSPENPRCFVENRDTRADGQTGWTQWLNEGVFDEAGQLVEIQSVGRDISVLKQVETALRNSEERLRLVTENMSDLVCLHQIDGQFLYVTPSSHALLGYLPQELIGRNLYELIHPADRDRVRQQMHRSTLGRQADVITYRVCHQHGTDIWLETLAKPIYDHQGQIRHLQTTSRNVSDRIKAEQQLKYDALHDGLTHLPNRTRLMHRLELALKRTQSNPRFQFAVLFLDLDNFKVVNDSLGHLVGDELLIAVAGQLQHFVRDTDLAARLGGDEFVILIEEIQGIHEAVTIAERILEGLRSPFPIANREVFISTSIGIVAGGSGHERAADLLRDADLAMYRAKQSGRSQYAIFDPMMHLQVMQRLHLEQDLRKALERAEFVLFYQPIVALETLQIIGLEVLMRWQHPQRGLVSPLEFIPIAEENGLIIEIGQWTLRTACQQLAEWQTQFPEQPLKISINLSVKQLQSTLLAQLRDALDHSQIAPDRLVLELTESMLVKHVDMTQALLEQIRALGIRLSIDDFGTGYSSLSYLSKLPVDTLKIDRTFVSPDNADARNQVIAESIIALSNLLELGVIAEGIQTPEQLEWLRKLGCKQGQGYLFSPPVAAESITQLLRQAVSLKL